MDGVQSNEAGSSLVSITVLSVTPVRAGKLFALASVEIDIDGVRIEVRGIRAMRVPTGATRVELPTFRDAAGQSRAAICPARRSPRPDRRRRDRSADRTGSRPSDGLPCRPRIDHRRPPPFRTYIMHGKRGRILEAWFSSELPTFCTRDAPGTEPISGQLAGQKATGPSSVWFCSMWQRERTRSLAL